MFLKNNFKYKLFAGKLLKLALQQVRGSPSCQ